MGDEARREERGDSELHDGPPTAAEDQPLLVEWVVVDTSEGTKQGYLIVENRGDTVDTAGRGNEGESGERVCRTGTGDSEDRGERGERDHEFKRHFNNS